MLPQSTDDWALGLHSSRALSSQPQGHSTQKKSFFATFPLTNHIPAPYVLAIAPEVDPINLGSNSQHIGSR
jgi:hypothetical protein